MLLSAFIIDGKIADLNCFRTRRAVGVAYVRLYQSICGVNVLIKYKSATARRVRNGDIRPCAEERL